MFFIRNVREFCKEFEKIENFAEAALSPEKYDCHHRLETHNSDGEKRLVPLSRNELITLDMYYNRPPEELVFLTHSEHSSLHQTGRKLSEAAKRKIGDIHRGRKLSEAAKRKIGDVHRGKKISEDQKLKLSIALKGRKFSKEHKARIGKTKEGNTYVRGTHWYNNGEKNIRAFTCPNGFTAGKLRVVSLLKQ